MPNGKVSHANSLKHDQTGQVFRNLIRIPFSVYNFFWARAQLTSRHHDGFDGTHVIERYQGGSHYVAQMFWSLTSIERANDAEDSDI